MGGVGAGEDEWMGSVSGDGCCGDEVGWRRGEGCCFDGGDFLSVDGMVMIGRRKSQFAEVRSPVVTPKKNNFKKR